MPSSPAAKHTAMARYGLQAQSGHLSSTLVPAPLAAGTLISGLLLVADHAIYVGASYPGTNLLYEFTIGLVMAVIALICSINPAIKLYASSLSPFSSSALANMLFPSLSDNDILICIPEPHIPYFGFGINDAYKP